MKIEYGNKMKASVPCKICGHSFVRVYSYYFDDGLIKVGVCCDNCEMCARSFSLIHRKYAEARALFWWHYYNTFIFPSDDDLSNYLRHEVISRVNNKKELLKYRLTDAVRLCVIFTACLLAMSILETAICRHAAAQGSYFDPATGATTHLVDGDDFQ